MEEKKYYNKMHEFMDKCRVFMSQHIKKPYYYVPPCPICGSRMTGHFIKYHRKTEVDWMINESLRNGEIVRPTSDVEINNAFCMACHHMWHENIKMKLFSCEQILIEKEERHTVEILTERYDKIQEEEGKRRGPVNAVAKFVGKI